MSFCSPSCLPPVVVPRTAPGPCGGHRSSLEKPGRGHRVGRTSLSPLAVTAGTFSCWAPACDLRQPGRAVPCEVQGALVKQSLIIVCWHVSTVWCRSQLRKEGVGWGRVPPPHTSSILHHQDTHTLCCQELFRRGLNTLWPKMPRIKGSERRQVLRMQFLGPSALVFPYRRSWHGEHRDGELLGWLHLGFPR